MQITTQTTASVSWISAGSAVDSYMVSWRSGQISVPVTNTTCYTVPGLDAGSRYNISVRAQNDAGRSEISTVSATTGM